MLTRLRALFGGKDPRPPRIWPMPAPDRPLAVIGDIHGCDDALARLLNRLDPALDLVLVGDYVDRGEQSAAVLRRVMDLPGAVCLRGNHEQMLLDFVAAPERAGPRWLRNGGLQTLASFGITRITPATSGPRLTEAAVALCAAMGPTMLDWLGALPLVHRSGTVAFVHAAADPARPIDRQQDADLLWGHPAFLRGERSDGIWVVHGHTIVETPHARAGRIAVDTGAYATGRLTAAVLGQGDVRFVTT